MESDQGKLFLGGISWETDEDTLKEHFSKYGTVLSVMIAKDRHTGDSRGFGFVSFSDSDSADEAFKDKHVILGRTVEVKRATPRSKEQPIQQQLEGDSHSQHQDNNGSSKKIFVGGLSDSLTEEEFKTYFEKFGRITDIVVMHDSMTNRPRGFGFVTFDSKESVEQVMQTNFHNLNGRRVEVKRAVPKERIDYNKNGYFNNGYWHGNYPPYSPGYGMLPVPGWDVYGTNIHGRYPMGGYNGIDYGIPPIGHTSPWNLLPYGYAHPRGYNLIVSPGIDGRSNYIVVASNGVTPRREKRS